MTLVNGRSISRDKSNDVEKGRALVSSFAMLSEGASPEYKEKLQSLIKKIKFKIIILIIQ
mgnify:CR=1 FL=1